MNVVCASRARLGHRIGTPAVHAARIAAKAGGINRDAAGEIFSCRERAKLMVPCNEYAVRVSGGVTSTKLAGVVIAVAICNVRGKKTGVTISSDNDVR